MQCSRCGDESMVIGDLRFCAGCVKPFYECTCPPKTGKT